MGDNTQSRWTKSPWNPEEDWCSNSRGIWVVGKVISTRFHTCVTQDALLRFTACVIQIHNAYGRTWNAWGTEETPVWDRPSLSKNKVFSDDELLPLIGLPEGLLSAELSDRLYPTIPRTFEFWAEPDVVKGVAADDEIMFKTKGGFFIIWAQKNDGSYGGNFQGREGALMNRVGAIMASVEESDVLDPDKMDGCDDDEWSD